ncbi:hemolysin family protein [Rarobacter incanus]|uniref:CBS domain containing-hemolysin-like protein n=1 Tax=Rarobacter incanus TaxID=153494 RepID=A0A542SRF0_9MICO|nr:hemolysin family protein [Rarobacter incanus]TQK77168.1 CBS domain containing-hemolysin-like protein [Rarobacter incanus]
MNDYVALAIGVVLTLGTAIFVASEFALVTLDPALLADKKQDRRSRTVIASLRRLSTELSSSQVGITVTTILLGYVSQPALSRLFAELLSSRAAASGAALAVAGTLSMIAINVFSMLFGELVPKNYALSAPWQIARLVVPLQRAFTVAFKPLIAVLDGSANAILRRCGIEPREELSGARSAQELAALVRRSAQMGTLETGVARLLTNSIELDELFAVDVMTDRTRVSVISSESSAADVITLARATGHSRFPITGSSRDDIVGLVQVRKALAIPRARRESVPVTAIMDEAHQVPETVPLRSLLVELRDAGSQLAIVVDEYGGTSGIVTLEDVIEEIVGDVADEHDRDRALISAAGAGAWTVSGLARPDEVAEVTDIVLPESAAYETVGGLIMARLGRIAQAGDTIDVDTGPGGRAVQLRVEAMAGRRVGRVRIRLVPGTDAAVGEARA